MGYLADKINYLMRAAMGKGMHKRRLQVIFMFMILGIVAFFMGVLNFVNGHHMLSFVTTLFALSSFAYAFVEYQRKAKLVILQWPIFISVILLALYFIIGGGEQGFSPVWLLLLPACGPFVLGLKRGCTLGGIVFVCVVLFYCTDWGRSCLITTEYSDTFLNKYPLVYFTFFLVGIAVEFMRESSYQETAQTKEILEATVAAGDFITYDLDLVHGWGRHNARWCEFIEMPGKATDGEKRISDLLVFFDADSRKQIDVALNSGTLHERVVFDSRVVTHENNEKWLRVVGRVEQVNTTGRPTRILGVGIDISPQKEKENLIKNYADDLEKMVSARTKELEESRQAALDASQAKTSFLSTVSHEIRTPMNAIMGYIHLFSRENLTRRQQDQLDKIQMSSSLLLNLINDILDISKIEAGRLDLQNCPYNLFKSIELARAIVASIADGKGIGCTARIEDNVPEYVEGDAQRLSQVLLNILNNAVKFTDKGYVSLHVGVRDPQNATQPVTGMPLPQDNNGRVILGFTIKDTGIGIAADKLDKIFQPFVQADSSITRRFGGTGLGLSICKKIVEMRGGTITVCSTEGEGTTFDVILPVLVTAPIIENDDAPAEMYNAMSRKAMLETIVGKHVLLVEDNLINLEVAQAMLEQYGLLVSHACNGQESVEMVKTEKYDCVFMDMQMPVMSGIDASIAMRDMGNHAKREGNTDLAWLATVPIIAMTANAMDEDRKSCLDAGMDDHISKPIDPETLEHCLIRSLGPQR